MPVLIVDGMSIFHNVAGAAAYLDRGYAYSFITQVTSVVKKFQCGPVWVCWEGGLGGREKIFPGYKANRTGVSTNLIRSDRESAQQLLTLLGVDQFIAPGYESDDTVAYLSNKLKDPVIIYSGDKDFLHLVNKRVSLYQKVRVNKTKNERILITPSNFQQCTGWVDPKTWFLGQLAIGDAVDGIPGLPGVGDGVIHGYHHGLKIAETKRQKLDEFYNDSELMLRNKSLMDLRGIKDLQVVMTPGEPDMGKSMSFLQELGFASIVGRYPEWFEVYERACSK